MRHLALPFYCAVVVILLLALLARVIYTDAGSFLPPVLFGIGYFSWRGIKDARKAWPEFKADRQRDADHAAAIARLRAELQNAAKAALDAVALSCEKEREADALRAEVEGLRNALEKIASIRLNDHASIDAAYGHACSIANEALFDHSDAAMGASA